MVRRCTTRWNVQPAAAKYSAAANEPSGLTIASMRQTMTTTIVSPISVDRPSKPRLKTVMIEYEAVCNERAEFWWAWKERGASR